MSYLANSRIHLARWPVTALARKPMKIESPPCGRQVRAGPRPQVTRTLASCAAFGITF